MAAPSSTAGDTVLIPCEIESCQRISATHCYHCNKRVCRPHFNEHADQLMQELNPLADSINALGEKINSFCVKEYQQVILGKLTKWRDQCIKNVNEFYELKKEQVDLLFENNKEVFPQQTSGHHEKLVTLRNQTETLVTEGDVTYEQLQILKQKLSALEDDVNNTHSLIDCDPKPLLLNSHLIPLCSRANGFMTGGSLLSIDHQMQLNDFYGNPKEKWELIYKATRDGFRAEDFHLCSDSKGPTVTIIQAKNGNYLFGGYTKIPWTGDTYYKRDPAAFVFTLTNPNGIPPTKFSQKGDHSYSICHGQNCGPIFGGAAEENDMREDLRICTEANQNDRSKSEFPIAYIDTTGKGATLFTGTKNFMVAEIEVYKCEVERSA